jgi:hypothetical protein
MWKFKLIYMLNSYFMPLDVVQIVLSDNLDHIAIPARRIIRKKSEQATIIGKITDTTSN